MLTTILNDMATAAFVILALLAFAAECVATERDRRVRRHLEQAINGTLKTR